MSIKTKKINYSYQMNEIHLIRRCDKYGNKKDLHSKLTGCPNNFMSYMQATKKINYFKLVCEASREGYFLIL